MRTVLNLGRLCLRQNTRLRSSTIQQLQRTARRNYGQWGGFQTPPKRKGLILAAVGLTPAIFVQLSEKDNGGTEQTAEGRMLEASREEIAKKLSEDDHGISRARHSVILFLDLYLWEPFCTGIRFLHLVIIFVPLIVSVPAIWLGPRNPKRDNERSGTIWWYNFLVKSMERAGPAFIKACRVSGCMKWC